MNTNWLCERAKLHYDRREIPEALFLYQMALDAGDSPAKSAFERWACWMMIGQFEQAWCESDRAGPAFTGRHPFEADHVLVRCLRGFGDAIQFLRFAPALRRFCGHLSVQAPAGLLPLLELVPAIDAAIPLDRPAKDVGHDSELECSDLPYLFRTTPGTIPPGAPIVIPPHLLRFREDRPGEGVLNVGVVWKAGKWNPSRSLPFDFLALWMIPGIRLISLQQESEGLALREATTEPLSRCAANGRTIIDTAVLLSRLDLVISVDTMVAHLAGTLGKPVWTLLPFAADWRWMLERTDSPWYPSMRLFRQPAYGDWRGLVLDVATELLAIRGAPMRGGRGAEEPVRCAAFSGARLIPEASAP